MKVTTISVTALGASHLVAVLPEYDGLAVSALHVITADGTGKDISDADVRLNAAISDYVEQIRCDRLAAAEKAKP